MAEIKNMSMLNMKISMVKAEIVKPFMGRGNLNAIHIINICTTNNFINKPLYKAWTDLKSSVGHFKIFASFCYMHVTDQPKRKLDNISQVMILIRYN